MSDSGSDRGGGSDAEGSDMDEESNTCFDPHNIDKMSEKDRKKWEKNLEKWRLFMDFLVRHIAIATFKYNCFEKDSLMDFMTALEKAEMVRATSKLKKGEEPRISSFKTMKESADMLTQQKYLAEANTIKNFLDLAGRMRGLAMIAGGFFKALKKGKVNALEKLKHYMDYWKGFCIRSFDYGELTFRGTDPERFNELERKYRVWPTVVRTAINLAQKFLKRASDSTGLDLISRDPKATQRHMQAAEFVVAARIEEMLFQRVVQESQNFLVQKSNLALTVPGSNLLNSGHKHDHQKRPASTISDKYNIPELVDIEPELVSPIPDTGILLNLPPDVPKEKKKGKKGKKKGRGASASSHKSTKKKKKK